jgi:chitinase
MNFGNRCWGGTYPAPGYNGVVNHALDALQSQCTTLGQVIPICQATYGKKILPSLGGATKTYQLNGIADGQKFADFLWGAFGHKPRHGLHKSCLGLSIVQMGRQ